MTGMYVDGLGFPALYNVPAEVPGTIWWSRRVGFGPQLSTAPVIFKGTMEVPTSAVGGYGYGSGYGSPYGFLGDSDGKKGLFAFAVLAGIALLASNAK